VTFLGRIFFVILRVPLVKKMSSNEDNLREDGGSLRKEMPL
jgi:hypothetical protein